MNTRLQVEHPVTELVTGIDLVEWQIRIARGERLTVDRARAADAVAATPSSAASTPRIRTRGFMPAPGTHHAPAAAVRARHSRRQRRRRRLHVPVHYDSMISKLVAWGSDRTQAIARLRRALGEYQVRGIRTTLPFFRWLVLQDDFAAARFDTTTLDTELASRQGRPFVETPADALRTAIIATALEARARAARPAAAAAGGRAGQPVGRAGAPRGAAMSASRIDVVAGGRVHSVHIEPGDGPTRVRVRVDDGEAVVIDAAVVGSPNAATTWSLRDVVTGLVSTAAVTLGSSGDGEAVVAGPRGAGRAREPATAGAGDAGRRQRRSARRRADAGKVVKVLVAVGDTVEPRQGLVVVEAMKMENELTVSRAGTVSKIEIAEGASVEAGRLLMVVS